MELIRKILEFDVGVTKNSDTHTITKRRWGNTRALIETQLAKINSSIWDGMSKPDIAQAISRIIYLLTLMACNAEIEELVKEYLRTEHRK